MANIGSHVDGLGMCVNTSIEILCHYLGLSQYYGYRDWTAKKEGGGSYSKKVDQQLAAWEKAMGVTEPVPYLQYEGPNPEAVLEALDRAGLPCAHTYGWSPRYNKRIAHMVCGVHYGTPGQYAVVLDNNPMQDFNPAQNKIFEWMSREEMIRRAKLGQSGNMWIFAWLAPPPPPVPKAK